MSKNSKILLGVLTVVVVVLIGVLVTNSELLQGRINTPGTSTKPPSDLYNHKGSIVSVVTTPVPSVVISQVTTPGGTTSVPSVVTSPVASPVGVLSTYVGTLPKGTLAKLPKLTRAILESIAKKDFIKNPKKYILTESQKAKILEMYKRNNTTTSAK
jgi:hypothetical protein